MNIKRKNTDEIILFNLKKIKLDLIDERANEKNINKKRKRSRIDEISCIDLKKIKLEESILPYSIDISMYQNCNYNYNYMMSYIK